MLWLLPLSLLLAGLQQWALLTYFGMAVGFVLQRSRFCLTAAFRDLILFDQRETARALVLLMLLSSIGFAWLQAHPITVAPLTPSATQLFASALPPGTALPPGKLAHLTWLTGAGGLLFGLGMVLAGGCVSGSLWRLGEGYLVQAWTLLGTLVGAVLGYFWHRSGWDASGPVLHLPSLLGWPGALALQLALLALLLAWLWWTDPLREPATPSGDLGRQVAAIWSTPWPAWLGAVALALLGIAYFALHGRPWGVTGPFVFGPAAAAGSLDLWPAVIDGVMVDLGLFLGAAFAALLFREFRIRRPHSPLQARFALLGGVGMGLGSTLAHGCTWGALVNGVSSYSVHGWAFGLFLIPGAWLGSRWLRRHVDAL